MSKETNPIGATAISLVVSLLIWQSDFAGAGGYFGAISIALFIILALLLWGFIKTN